MNNEFFSTKKLINQLGCENLNYLITEIVYTAFIKTRMKTSIRYNKENDREKRVRERERYRRRNIEREGEIREREGEREVKGIYREWKGKV